MNAVYAAMLIHVISNITYVTLNLIHMVRHIIDSNMQLSIIFSKNYIAKFKLIVKQDLLPMLCKK